MRTSSFASVTTLALILTACADGPGPTGTPGEPASITNGTPTGPAFGAVGTLLYDFNSNGTVDVDDQLCTGSLIAPTVFLTAGHCVEWLPPSAQLYVSFEPSLAPTPATFITTTGFAYDPLYNVSIGNPHDLAVVFLPAGSTAGITPLKLPPADYLDQLAARGGLRKAVFINVGYGVSANHTGRPAFGYDGLRRQSESLFMALTPTWLGLRMNAAATGKGGDCYGDSGGPKFLLGDPTTVLAHVVTGDPICRATTWDYRLDTQAARDFLDQFVTLP
jgi:hypothetical protein